ncbi:MAG: hypothetical protein KKG33_04825 [candidate division Zixibacteria bacterium]|nr:hypothetical protein [candidate division Zixibacteria bacterium]MBU1469135.1 hypothetical protein [candidate division Zixibacteria bacterium]MBU2624865.1 hypothetical protein [candidate division Zixibacteria bacterium]
MKIALLIGLMAVGLGFLVMPADVSAESGRIYGTIRTVDGEDFEGWIRWDKNEAFWDDILDGTKERSSKKYRSKSRRSSKRSNLFDVARDGFFYSIGSSRQSEVKFGHIKTLVPLSSSEALIVLKSGIEFEMTGSDVGSGVREIVIDDRAEGEIYLDWDDIDEVNFQKEPNEPESKAERLYGKVTIRRGDEYVGWIEWDVDEVLSTDVIDGDEGSRRNRKIRFEKIQSIERRSRSSALITLKTGKTMRLSGSNDVNSENRGIRVKSAELGRVNISWSDFEKLDLMPVPLDRLPKYDSFDGGKEISGTVFTEDGEQFTGRIVWDEDETYTWEHLNGDYDDCSVVVEFSNIQSIEKSSRRGSVVTTKSGRNIVLKGSNDVDSDNNGIIVFLDNGDEVEVDWHDFEKAEFK